MSSKPLPDRQKAEEEAAEIAQKALAVDKTSIWAKLLLPLVYSSFFVGSVAYILTDRIGPPTPCQVVARSLLDSQHCVSSQQSVSCTGQGIDFGKVNGCKS